MSFEGRKRTKMTAGSEKTTVFLCVNNQLLVSNFKIVLFSLRHKSPHNFRTNKTTASCLFHAKTTAGG